MEDRYLFKGKRLDSGEWVQGALFNGESHCIIGQEIKFSPYTEHECKIVGYEVDRDTICQCTAVPDRDNTIMFENDVVRASGGVRGVIRFGRYGDEKTDYGFYIEWEKSQPYWRNDIYYWQNELRVIGSYIDNPELLEVE